MLYFQEPFSESDALEDHILKVHQVNTEGLQRLLLLAEGWHCLNRSQDTPDHLKTPQKEGEEKMEADNSVVISEKHVYKYKCNHCSLAFKTQEKLQLHSQYHLIPDTTKCKICDRSFRTIQALLKHIEGGHPEVSSEELAQYRLRLMTNPLLFAGISEQILDLSTNELLKKESMREDEDDKVVN